MSDYRTYKDLEVCQIAHKLGIMVHQFSLNCFLVFSHASCNETIEWVEYIRDCYPDLNENAEDILSTLDELGRKLNRFIRAVEKDHKS